MSGEAGSKEHYLAETKIILLSYSDVVLNKVKGSAKISLEKLVDIKAERLYELYMVADFRPPEPDDGEAPF